MLEVRIKPNNEKQQQFLKERHKYVGFGGAKGGGKSWAVREKAIMYALIFPGIREMIIRRTYPELRENHINQLVRETKGIAVYNDQRKELKFYNGSVILFRYCRTDKDLQNFQGIEIDVLFVDEATQFDEIVFDVFCSCVRGVNSFSKQIHITCNPGGTGHSWVKRRFIDKRMNDNENADDYVFIKSLLDDNIALMTADPDYDNRLQALPYKLREAYRYGNGLVDDGICGKLTWKAALSYMNDDDPDQDEEDPELILWDVSITGLQTEQKDEVLGAYPTATAVQQD